MIHGEPPGTAPGPARPGISDRSGLMAPARAQIQRTADSGQRTVKSRSALRLLSSVLWLLAAGLALGCRGPATAPAEEKVPPAPVKWEGVRHVVLEEWV